jgi:hypothetical protein
MLTTSWHHADRRKELAGMPLLHQPRKRLSGYGFRGGIRPEPNPCRTERAGMLNDGIHQ